MATTTTLIAAGGTDDGGIGTSFDRIQAGLAAAQRGEGVVVLCDLGSAVMTAETVVEFLDDEARSLVRIADAAIVEGAVAAAVAAESGASLEGVLSAAETAGGTSGEVRGEDGPAPSVVEVVAGADDATLGAEATVELRNRTGLHARPAAELVKLASTFDAAIRINGKDAKSLLGIMALGLGKGARATITAEGAEAQQGVDALVALIDSGFGEV